MELDRLLAQLDETGLAEFFSVNALARARGYVGRVRELEGTANILQAQVQGSERRPYKVWVRIERREFLGQRSIDLATRCTCPVGNRCKHAAALILAARREGAIVDKPRAEILAWARGLRQRLDGALKAPRKSPVRDGIVYLFRARPGGDDVELALAKARFGDDGGIAGGMAEWTAYEQALLKPPSFVQEQDLRILRLLRQLVRRNGLYAWPVLRGEEGYALFECALESGRAWLDPARGEPPLRLHAAARRPARLVWAAMGSGTRPRVIASPPAAIVARSLPLTYFDAASGEAGALDIDEPLLVAELLALPPLAGSELPLVAAAMAEVDDRLPLPTGAEQASLPLLEARLEPMMRLESLPCWSWRAHRGYAPNFGGPYLQYDCAEAVFGYGEVSFAPGSTETIATLADGRNVRVKRDSAAEDAAWRSFLKAGFKPLKSGWLGTVEPLPEGRYGLEAEASWVRFFADAAPALKAAGWRIEATDFRHRTLSPEAWLVNVEEGEAGWLEVGLGVEVDGQRVDLAPLLHELFRQDRRWLDPAALAAIDEGESVVVVSPEGERIALPVGRIKPLASTLIDLFDRPGELRLSGLDADRLGEALEGDWRAEGMETLEAWRERLQGIGRVAKVRAPAGLGIKLRPYQREGLAWLQYLRANSLGGILADDMGLGKTAQALAHLLLEKRAGRLDKPALVVLPTSLVFNWQQEAARHAPALKVLSLRGSDRQAQFERIPGHDVCLTTYPLLWRDREALAAHHYHYLILDEAQTVKNAASQAAKVVRTLDARHRLCLTGTPLENHLGELWALFDFLLPGFLGDRKDFASRWRTPIEKHGDVGRRELLARRVAPFILRRRKDQVAQDLPAKSVVLRSVELEGRQRDLYETVRASMDQRVRDEVAARGFARSQIVILDALLKLRQVCCDPRLLPGERGARVKEGAKLDLLMNILPEMVDEGRRILVFSQFTGMLALIAEALDARGIAYLELTGDTADRAEPVRRFQAGEVPVFLVSLKAGGVGLNLTAADTVIHYDPWWNPAAENQATDRAHRIGQDKKVFVYKLVVAGSIEEKILALQEKKAALAAGILSEDRQGAVKFGEEDIRNLLAPLPEPDGTRHAATDE